MNEIEQSSPGLEDLQREYQNTSRGRATQHVSCNNRIKNNNIAKNTQNGDNKNDTSF